MGKLSKACLLGFISKSLVFGDKDAPFLRYREGTHEGFLT